MRDRRAFEGRGRNELFLFAALAALTLAGTCARQARAQIDPGDVSSKIERLFREGVDLFEMGKYPQARVKLRQVLELDPKAKEAWKLVKMAGEKILMQMLTEPQMVGREARVIWELYRLHVKRLITKPDLVKRLADVAIDPRRHPTKRWDAMERLTQIGQFVIPYLVEALGNTRDDEVRALARVTATRMGRSVTLPVIQLLRYRPGGLAEAERATLVRENAAIILGDIKDKRALAALKRLAEDEEESAVVRKWALMSLQKITGLDVGRLKSSQDYYWLEADRYVRELPGVANEAKNADGVIWRLEDGMLVDRQIARFTWNELMAEQACYECIAIDPEYEVIYPLFAEVFASQIAEAIELLDVALERPVGRPFTEEEKTDVRSRLTKLLVEPLSLDSQGPLYVSVPALKVPRIPVRRNLLLSTFGPVYIYRAIDKCLVDARQDERELPALAAVVLCDIAYALDPDGELLPRRGGLPKPGRAPARRGRRREVREVATSAEGAPLIKALRFPDERVRYAAAIALARMNPPVPFEGADEVISTLALAVSESGPIHVLIVEEDPSIRNELAGKLRELDMTVSTAGSAREGLVRATGFPPCDVVLVSPNLETEESTEWLLENMRDDPRARRVAVAIITSYAKATEHKTTFKPHENVKSYVPVEDSGGELRKLIETAAKARATPIMSKKRSEELSVIAAETLCQMNPHLAQLSGMQPDQLADPCIAALKNRSDLVRRPCIDALGRFHIAKAHDRLMELFRDPMQTLDIRVAAARAVSLITPEADLGRLLEAAQDQKLQYVLRYLGAESLGHGSPKGEKLREILDALRLPLGGRRVLKTGEPGL